MYKLLLFIIIMQLLNVSGLVGFRICISFVKNLALLIFIYFFVKNLVFLRIKVLFVCILIISSAWLSFNVISKHELYVKVFICKFFM